MWATYAPTFTIRDVKLSELEKRTKNAKKDVAVAEAIKKKIRNKKADACSARFVDEDGKTLVCVFANRIEPSGAEKEAEESKDRRSHEQVKVTLAFFGPLLSSIFQP